MSLSDTGKRSPHRQTTVAVPVWRDSPEMANLAAPEMGNPLAGFIQAMRLHQWAKNLLVLVPLPLAGFAADSGAWLRAGTALLALGLIASATYIVNDLIDIENDRQHPKKRFRAIASGRIAPSVAVLGAALLGALAFYLCRFLPAAAHIVLATYVVTTLVYSLRLKQIVILDCLLLGFLFTLRLTLGAAAIGAIWSPWLLTFSMFLFTSLSLAKRYVEVRLIRRNGKQAMPGRGYTRNDGPAVMGLGIAAAVASLIIFILYLANEAFRNAALNAPMLLWGFPPVLFLFISRIWLLAGRDELNDDPVAFATRDGVSLGLGMLAAALFALASIGL